VNTPSDSEKSLTNPLPSPPRDRLGADSAARSRRSTRVPEARTARDLGLVAKAHMRLVRQSLEPGPFDTAMRFCQRTVGARWINAATTNLRHFHGTDRLPALDPAKSYVCVSNHRSFFDMYVITAHLVAKGMPHRLLFPVRANFFYDNPLGIVVNGAMSFFAMYPPVFRDRAHAAHNLASVDEVTRLLVRGGAFVGLHPEGTRNKGDDPYTFLPAQSGVGRIIHQSKVDVIPVFVNGLTNSIAEQIRGNVTRKGEPVIAVFGRPIDFGALLAAAPSPRVYKQISERCLEVVSELGREEKGIRAGLAKA
jgi:1-acyl-sn-glycerol-3-phosphate acyltransferase